MVLAFAWALYLIPKAVKQQDETGRNRPVDGFSSAMRVLARSEPADEPTRVACPPAARRAAARVAARAAARRRRRITLVLLLADLVTVALAAFAVAPWWTVAVPAALTLLYLALCRRQVSRENMGLWAPQARSGAASAPRRRAVRVDTGHTSAPLDGRPGTQDAGSSISQEMVPDPATESETVGVAADTVDDGTLWDPLPLTLPTYVNKARASRTVRTIDLGVPGTWSSGRDEADSAPVDDSFVPQQGPLPREHRRAVGH